MKSVISFLLTDHGPQLHRAARVAGAVAALLITWAWLAGEAAYDLGRQLRLALEERNDQIAAAWLALLGLVPPAPVLVPAPVAVAFAPVALLPMAPAPVATPPAAPKRKAVAKAPAAKPAKARKPRVKAAA